MSHFCFGAYTRILLSCAPKNVKNKFLCGTLLMGLDENYDIREDDDTVSHILSGTQNLSPQIIECASEVSASKLEAYFEKEIVHRLDENKKTNAILALKEIIGNDCSILGTTQLGTLSNKTKDDFIRSVDLPFTEILTDLFLYAILKTDNTLHKKETKAISRSFCDQYNCQRNTINIYELPQIRPVQVVPLTVLGKKFNTVFTPVGKEVLAITNNNDFQIFRLAIENNEFSYSELEKFLLNNLGNYVFSRIQVQEIIDSEEFGTIAVQAIRLMNETGLPGVKGTGSELGEMLLYIFLEQVLQAPKLMSKVELSTVMSYKKSKSDSVHLLSDGAGLNNQLVFGTSYVEGDLQAAIDAAFDHVLQIKNFQSNEISLVESTIFYQSFKPEVSALVKDIIVPQKGRSERPDKAFGMFLGYSIDKDYTPCSNDEYRNKVTLKMERDIANNVQYIQDKINALGLSGYSFYIYVLPFNDAICDKQSIMVNLMTLGGGCQ